MKKRMTTTFSLLLAIVLFAACAAQSSLLVNAMENNGNGFWNLHYERFDGSKDRQINLSGKGPHTIRVDIETNEGALDLSIEDDAGTQLYRGSELPTSSFEVEADSEGTYHIRLEADNHSGGFSVEWE